jgi:long-chain acyl-CoA synthetase
VISARGADTLWGLFRLRVQRSPDCVAYRDYEVASGRWRDHTWRTIAERVDLFRSALSREKLKPGDRAAVLLVNGIDWICFDVAAHAVGLVVVGLYPQEAPATNAYILGHSDARLLLTDNEARWRELAGHRATFPLLQRSCLQSGPGLAMASSSVLSTTAERQSNASSRSR